MAKQATATATAPALPAAPRGTATRARWGACLAKVQGASVLMGPQVKAMPLTTVITCNVAQNPKRGQSLPAFAAYGFGGRNPQAATVGATTTLGAYYTALHKAMAQGATQAAAHVAWDVNHGYIALSNP